MDKRELKDIIAEQNNLLKVNTETVINSLFDEIKYRLQEGEDVKIKNFGTFTTVNRAPRVGWDLNKREKINIPEKRTVVFKPSAELKRLVSKPIKVEDHSRDSQMSLFDLEYSKEILEGI